MRIPQRGERGFTLIELLIVIAIIGVIAAIAVPVFLNQDDSAENAALEAELSSAMDLLALGTGLGSTLPSSFPAGQVTTIPGAGSFEPSVTLTVSGSGSDMCVDGTTPAGTTISLGLASGLQTVDCATANANPTVLTYANTTFTAGSNNETLSPTVTGGAGTKTYSVSGTLPAGVTFDTATGVFTGPADSAWNFTVAQIDAGGSHTCVVTTTGGAKCWGNNGSGQLGDGTTTNSSTPVDVSGLTSGVASISAGASHTCAVTTTGGAKCWGNNNNGRLGDGTTTASSTPVDVSGLTSGVASISAAAGYGGFHTCAVTTTGGAKCWGANNNGQLGIGTTTASPTPVDVSGLTSGVASVSAAGYHTCALTTTGGAKCWGNNSSGQLGDGSTTRRTTPVDVSGLTSGVASVSAGSDNACAVTTTGGAKCWGGNWSGQLGDGTTTASSTPVDVSGLTSGVASVAGGEWYTCALTTTGGAKCWGGNGSGQLGDGTTAQRTTAVDVSNLGPQPGFPATVDVTVTDSLGSVTQPVTLTVS